MADEKEQADSGAKKGGMVTIIGVLVLMLLEAGAVYFVASMTKSNVSAEELPVPSDDLSQQPVEIQLLDDNFQNADTGRRWLWTVEVVVLVKPQNRERVEEIMGARQATIREGISQIIGGARHKHLEDPTRQTIRRQIHAMLDEIFGIDGNNEPRVADVLLPRLKGVVGDF